MKKNYTISFFFLFFISQSFAQTNNAPTAVNDTANTYRGHIKINVLSNDFDIDGNSFIIYTPNSAPMHGTVIKINDSTFEYQANPSFAGSLDSFSYRIRDNGNPQMMSSLAKVYLNVDNSYTIDSVNINNINAGFLANGNLFWELNSLGGDVGSFYQSHFEVPKGSKKSTIFSAAFWIGGKDSLDSLHFAGQRYNQVGYDFWAGPVSNIYDSLYDDKWKRLWKIKKSEIDYHLAHCWSPGYVPAQSLIDWPGNGDMSQGQLPITAPFKDWNNDGIYNPWAGDYPLIKGDEAVYFIYNDDREIHTESKGTKLKVEVHGMAYSFDCISDSALWNTVFLNYKIFNRSANTYDSTFFNTFMDFDIGDPYDDYVACDVQRSAFYGYNGKNIDGDGGISTFGTHPPAQAIVFLAGAKMDKDGIDNPSGLCDEGINGFNFGNGIADDERFGLTRFMYFNNGGPFAISDPEIAPHYYNYMKGLWKDGAHMIWGGDAHPMNGGCGPECKFMFPAFTDSCNWNTGGIIPNCDTLWNEVTANNPPGDRRGVGSTGPFTFKPNDVQELDLAFVFGRNYIDSLPSAGVAVMNERIDSIRSYFFHDATPCGGSFSAVNEVKKQLLQINVFPNPSTGIFTIQQNNSTSQKYSLSVRNIQGQLMLSEKVEFEKTCKLDISKFANGIYFLSLQNENEQIVKKVVVQH